MGWWFAGFWDLNPMLAVAWVLWVVVSIVLHELGHGWAALRLGDDTPRATGHMTWNPLVHMGWMSLLMLAVVGIAWGLMPVDPTRLRGRHGDAVVALAGPTVNLALFAACLALMTLTALAADPGTNLGRNLMTLWFVGAALNLTLMLFNLVPVPPLDGSRIVASFSDAYRRFASSEQGAVVSLIAFVVLFMWGGGRIFGFAFGTTAMLAREGMRLAGARWGGLY